MRTSFAVVLALIVGVALADSRPKKDCKEPKKWKAAPSVLLQKSLMARSFSAAGHPDPTCRNVNGQKSANACCASQVADLSCDKGKVAPNVCLKACSESTPPCMLKDDDFTIPDVTSAAEDCNEAVGEYMDTVEAAVKGAKGGKKQWDKMEADGKIFSF